MVVVVIDTCLPSRCVGWVRVMGSVVAMSNAWMVTGGCRGFMDVLGWQQSQRKDATHTQSCDAHAQWAAVAWHSEIISVVGPEVKQTHEVALSSGTRRQ